MHLKHANRLLGTVKCIGLCGVRKYLNLEITGSVHDILLSMLDCVRVEASSGDCVTLCSLLCYHESYRRGIMILGS